MVNKYTRQSAKKEIESAIDDWDSKWKIATELANDEEIRMAIDCYEQEKLDPENYKCTCVVPRPEDYM